MFVCGVRCWRIITLCVFTDWGSHVSHHRSATSILRGHVEPHIWSDVMFSLLSTEVRAKINSLLFHFVCRFSKIWARTCWRRRLRATTPASSPTVRPARGSPTPWWEIQWDQTHSQFVLQTDLRMSPDNRSVQSAKSSTVRLTSFSID